MLQPLQPNDRIAVIALASCFDYEQLLPGLDLLQNQWGLEVVEGQTLRAKHHQFAGDDALRLHDFQTALDDPTIKAVFSARGGYGCSRIIDAVSFKKFKKNPKWVVGFSDITLILSHLHNIGFESLHAEMPKSYGKADRAEAVESVRKLLFGESLNYEIKPHALNRLGDAKGQLVGGNLCLLAHAIGSKSELNTKNKLLFIEDVGEPRYNIDRLMIQLKRANKLSHLAGLIVGQFNDVKDENPPFGQEPYEIIAQHVAEYDYPVCFDFPVGHTAQNWAMPVGRTLNLGINECYTKLVE